MIAEKSNLLTDDIVTISIEEDCKQDEIQKSNFQGKIDVFEKLLNQICNDLDKSFYRLEHLKRTTIDDIRNIAFQLQNSIVDYKVVISDIVLHGSGKDCVYRHCINVALLSYILGK